MTRLARTRAELAAGLQALPGPAVLVPTMGALHDGHAALLRAAGHGAVLSLFVNPLQFGSAVDLQRYPRSLEADLEVAAAHRVALVFAPDVEEVYPDGPPQVSVRAGAGGEVLEGASRPGHFDGVLTVVTKLFGLVAPAAAVFGEKDYQQLVLVRRLVRDLDLGVRIEAVPVVREPGGLARSSRNQLLSATGRDQARALSRALATGDAALARELLAAAPGVELDYCELVDAQTLAPLAEPPGRLLVAARVEGVRLIDNVAVPGAPAPAASAPAASERRGTS